MVEDLEGLLVLDCTVSLSGAYCAKLLGDAGAEVCLVEPDGGHPLRRWSMTDSVPDGDDGALFRYLRHGHRSVVAASIDVDAALAAADIVVTDGSPPAGDATVVADTNPGVVVVSITPYGLTGPYACRPGTEFTVQADAAAISPRGTRDRPPFQLGGRVIEWVTGGYAAVGALAAARRAAQTGHGDLIDVSMCEAANLTGSLFGNLFHAIAGRPPITQPARTIEVPSIEPTADGWVGFNTNTREQWEALCLLIERPELIVDGEFAALKTRQDRVEEWNEMVHAWTMKHTTAEVVEQAAALRIPVAPVTDGRTVLELEHARARGVFLDDPTGTMRLPRRPWRIDGEDQPPLRPSPAIGEHPQPFTTGSTRPAPTGEAAAPLAGLRVLDLTAWWAGPSATSLLAALGAEVVHVESAKRPDGMRMTGGIFAPLPDWWERSPFFLHANANKRDVTVDLASPRGRELALELVAWADVVVENYTPRVIESFGLDFDAVHAANPRAVMVRMPAFGLDGPWRDWPGFAQTMEQVTGLAWMTGYGDDQPRIQRGPCDPNGGLHAAFATLVALARRDRTGEGCLVEAPMFDAALAVAAEPVLEWTTYGQLVARDGNRGPAAVPQGLYAGAEEETWLAVACATDAQWAALVEVVDDPALRDPAFGDRVTRRRRHDEIDIAVRRWAAACPVDAAVGDLAAAGVPAAPVVDARLVHTHPHLVARGFFEDVDHPVAGRHPTPMLPWRARGVDRWVRSPAPLLGEGNADILGGVLGHPPEELAQLEADGVIGTRPPGL